MIQYDPHRWLDHFFDIRGSLVKEISGRVILCTSWSALVVYYHVNVTHIGIPSIIHTLTGLALGLLLVFRTNASYDRFWEGRKLWGGIVNETRNLVRSSSAFLESSPEMRQEISNWMLAFVYATMNSLRLVKGIGPVADKLDPEEVRKCLNSPHPGMFAAQKISSILQRAKSEGLITDYVQANIDQNVQLLVDYMGGCERIRKTPLPFAYVIHLRRALIIYCFTLPFALVDLFSTTWVVVLDTLFLSYIYFGIEEIGVEIEDPFGDDENDLPLEDICLSITKTTEGMR